jgi:hypothetical protein
VVSSYSFRISDASRKNTLVFTQIQRGCPPAVLLYSAGPQVAVSGLSRCRHCSARLFLSAPSPLDPSRAYAATLSWTPSRHSAVFVIFMHSVSLLAPGPAYCASLTWPSSCIRGFCPRPAPVSRWFAGPQLALGGHGRHPRSVSRYLTSR